MKRVREMYVLRKKTDIVFSNRNEKYSAKLVQVNDNYFTLNENSSRVTSKKNIHLN